jgi:hypothetical protein
VGRPGALALRVVVALAGDAPAQTLLDYVSFDGIDYIRWAEEPGRALGPGATWTSEAAQSARMRSLTM